MENNNDVVRKSALALSAGQLPRGLNFNENPDLEGDADPGENGTSVKVTNRMAEQNAALMQIISDPDVAALVALKRAGKQVQVGEKPAVTDTDPEIEDEQPVDILADIKDDDPHKELLGKIDALINAKLSPVSKKVERQLGELNQKAQKFESVANDITRKEVDTQIASAKEKFPDLEKLKPVMLELTNAHPTLDVEQLALLAANKMGTLKIQKSSTASERPTNIPRRPTAGNKTPQTRMGQKGFKEILAEKLGGLTPEQLGQTEE